MINLKLLAGEAVGVSGMYFGDPARGRGRRAEWRYRRRARARRAEPAKDSWAKDAANRAPGDVARGRGAGAFHPTDDRSVERHLHQWLAELDVDSHDVTVEVCDELTRARGQVGDEQAMTRATDELRRSRVVRGVESLLHLPEQPAPNKQAAAQQADRR